MISRREILKTSSIGLVGAIAGCSSGDDDESPGPGTTTQQQTDSQDSAYLTGVSTAGLSASVAIGDSEAVATVNAVRGDGTTHDSKSVKTGASSVSFQMLRGAPSPEPLVSPGTEFSFVAVNDGGEKLGSVEWVYDPQLELVQLGTGTTEFPEYDKSAQWLVFEVENTGTGPAFFNGGDLSRMEEEAVNRMDEAIVGEVGATTGHPAWFGDYPFAWNYLHPPSQLGGVMSTDYESATDHVVPGGETKKLVLAGFFKGEFEPQNLDQEPDYERSYSFTADAIPVQEQQSKHEFTVELTGEFKTSGESAIKEVWVTNTEVTSFGAVETSGDG